MKIETVIDRTDGGKGRICRVSVYIDGVLMQNTFIWPDGDTDVFIRCTKLNKMIEA